MKKNEEMKRNENVAEAAKTVVLKVVRELLDVKTSSGADMYAYVLKDKFFIGEQEREVKVDFIVKSSGGNKDMGGYEMLDIIFMLGDQANLSISEDFMINEQTGETVQFSVYEIWNEDNDGIKYSYKVQPSRASDKAKLDFILQKKKLELEKVAVAATKTTKQES